MKTLITYLFCVLFGESAISDSSIQGQMRPMPMTEAEKKSNWRNKMVMNDQLKERREFEAFKKQN